MIAALILTAAHVCPVPATAYRAADRLDWTKAEARTLWAYAECVCGPDGTVDMDPVPDRRGRYFIEPHCNRDGWNGRRYRGER
jgi:hypothetical protein